MDVSRCMTADFVRIAPDVDYDEAMELMDEHDIRHLPVVDGQRLLGILSDRDLLAETGWLPRRLREVLESPEGTVKELMRTPVASVSSTDSMLAACNRMLEWSIGCLPVVDDVRIVGVVTETDVLEAWTRALAEGAITQDPAVATLMSRDVAAATPSTTADEALALQTERAVRHLPVVEGDALRGLVSDRDLRTLAGRGQLEETPVADFLVADPQTIAPDARLSAAVGSLLADKIGALPVVECGKLVGILSTADVLRYGAQAL